MKMLQTTETSSVCQILFSSSSCGTDDFQLLRSPPMMINGRSPVWHAGTAYLHLTAGYTDIKMLIAKDLLLKKHSETNV